MHRLIALPAAAHGPRSVVINLIDSHRVKVYHSHNCIHIKTDAAVHIFFFFSETTIKITKLPATETSAIIFTTPPACSPTKKISISTKTSEE